MDFLKQLDNNSILLIPYDIKNKILTYINDNKLLINIKLLTFKELQNGLLYTYSNEAVYEVMKNNNISFETANDFIKNTLYLTDDKYEGKLQVIADIKNYLEKNNLFIKDELFIDLLKSKSKLYVYGFTSINKFQDYILNKASNYIEVIGIPNDDKNIIHEAHILDTLEDEVQYVAEHIANLIENGIPLEKIYISNYSKDYYFSIKKIFGLYNIPVYLKGDTKLSDTPIGKYFINNISDNMNKLLFDIRKKYDTDNNVYNSKVYNKLSNLINTYYWANSYVEIKDVIEAEMRSISIPNDHFDKEIATTNIIDNIFEDDEYVFLIGFNQKSIPRVYKDEDYIDDSIKTNLMENTLEKNIASKLRYKRAIKNIKNLTITLKRTSLNEKFLPSTLIDGEFITLVDESKNKDYKKYSNYSDAYNKILLANRLDDFIKFNEYSCDLEELYKSYSIDYKKYDNQITEIDKRKVQNKLSTKGYSYSSISTYYKCPFRFYLDYFYKLSEFETTFNTFIGSAFHKVMEECITDESKDIDDIYYKFIEDNKNNLPYGDKEKYYVEKVKDELYFIINTIRDQYKLSSHEFVNEWHEKYIEKTSEELGLVTNIKTIIKGVVDKCIFINNDVIIIDYKTGNSTTIDRTYFEYGIDIQLPIYLYLLKNIDSNYNIAGMYLQHILRGLIYRNDSNKKKSLDDIKTNNLKLDGLTLDDESVISKFDSSIPKSNIISGVIKNSKDEWKYPTRIMTYEYEEELYKTIEKLITDCINKTSDAKFNIEPIKDKKQDGCNWCSYKDICFKRENNIKYINKFTEEGDTNE